MMIVTMVTYDMLLQFRDTHRSIIKMVKKLILSQSYVVV